jgi:hypothetical protein
VRLTFTYEDDEIRLASQQPVEMIAPPTDALYGYEGEQGFWIEVCNGQDETLYRQVMQAPFRQDVEIFSPDPEQSIARIPAEKPSGIFTVLVPDLDGADHVVLMSSAVSGTVSDVALEAEARGLTRPTTELARFLLRPSGEGGGA